MMEIESKLLFLSFLFFGSSVCCDFNPILQSAKCNSVESAISESKVEWTNLHIKDYGNSTTHKLVKIGKTAFKNVPNLTDLILEGVVNRIGRQTLQNLKQLQSFEFTKNNVQKLPVDLFKNLIQLRSIFISDSGITSIEPGTFKYSEQLRSLTIKKNAIKIFPADTVCSTNIEVLYLDDNEIEEIKPLAFVNMPILKRLSLMGNKLLFFDAKMFFGTTSLNLYRLWLSNNNIKLIKSNTLDVIPNLEYLFLELNQISHIEKGAFHKLHKLISLDISNNQLWEISPDVFPKEDMKSLILLLLHNNKLTFIDEEVFNNKSKLKYVTYYDNPLICPCYSKIKSVLLDKNISQVCHSDTQSEKSSCIPQNRCSYDVIKNKYVYEQYSENSKEFSAGTKKCFFAEGYENSKWSINHR